MSLDFEKTFGASSASTAGASKEDLPKANVWMNIGVTVEVKHADGTTEDRFISLPVGIAIDTQEELPINSRSEDYNLFQAARNKLLKTVQAKAAGLDAGEGVILDNLEIQLRRVADAVVAPAEDAANPYAIELNL